ncbi:hypothetical protein PQQ51_24895 [Paraburkholderia xenovorans]|uniref:hypothetical protein n=1 Tax=Paraburkholderia xenovorans TaxID=36873 RepID=UPI0038B9423A
MTPERFQQIVEAYGADPHRWPDGERIAAETWALVHRAEADALLADAAAIDDWLAADKVAPPSLALQQRVVGSAPVRKPVAPRTRLWWSGAAVAGVGLLGGFAGALAVSFFVLTAHAPDAHESSYLTSSFGGASTDWSGE